MEKMHLSPIAILGAGSWGTALALYLSRLGQEVRLWTHSAEHAHALQTDRVNKRYLPEQSFPNTLHPTSELDVALAGTNDVLIAVPSLAFRETLLAIKPYLKTSTRIISATKGLDLETGQLLHDIAHDILGARAYAVLSGPSFALEVAKGLPTAVVIASNDKAFSQNLLQRFNSQIFRTYLSTDMSGVEIGGIAKNVIAIATGIADGMGFGANARCALITRGLAEIIRLGMALGCDYETFTGLSGVGDLVLTCTDNQSRNRRFGLALGKGKTPIEAQAEIGQVVEGARNAELIVQLAQKHQVNLPISEAVVHVLEGKLTPKEAVKQLLSRDPKNEA